MPENKLFFDPDFNKDQKLERQKSLKNEYERDLDKVQEMENLLVSQR